MLCLVKSFSCSALHTQAVPRIAPALEMLEEAPLSCRFVYGNSSDSAWGKLQDDILTLHRALQGGCLAICGMWETILESQSEKCRRALNDVSLGSTKDEITIFKNCRADAKRACTAANRVKEVVATVKKDDWAKADTTMKAMEGFIDDMEGHIYLLAIGSLVNNKSINQLEKGKATDVSGMGVGFM